MNWIRITKTFADFSFAGLTNNIEIYSLPAGASLHSAIMKHSTSFGGGAIATYTMSVGIIGDLTKYSYATTFDVFQAVSDIALFPYPPPARSLLATGIEDWGSVKSIRGSAISTGANLDQAVAGVIEYYLLVSQIRT